jgi:16S rRNA A1518/A1519 N6-dimethyltransferase RsmA/KsgA/DIM1 with predicted DNA glycosylase/AP lyase activity
VFQQRRKTIQNTLKSFYSLSQAELERIESESGIDLGLRPESLGKEEFLRLMRMLTG